MEPQERDVWYWFGLYCGWIFTWVFAVGIIALTGFLIVGGLVMMAGCGGSGGDVGGGDGTTTLATVPPGTAVFCNFGDNNSFTFNLGDNAALDFCTEGGGTVQPDNSTISQPTNSNNRTTNIVNPTPTPGSTG